MALSCYVLIQKARYDAVDYILEHHLGQADLLETCNLCRLVAFVTQNRYVRRPEDPED